MCPGWIHVPELRKAIDPDVRPPPHEDYSESKRK